MIKINKLTKKQTGKFLQYVKEGLKHGLSTEPLEKEKIEKTLVDVYKAGGQAPPKMFIYLKSPLGGVFGAHLLSKLKGMGQVGHQVGDQVRDQVMDQVMDQVRHQVWDQVGSQVMDQVWDQVIEQVWDQVGHQVWDQVGHQVREQVRDQVRGQVGHQVGDQVGHQVREQVGEQVRGQVWDQVWGQVWDQVWGQANKCGYGSMDRGWLDFYSYFINETDVQNIEKIEPLIKLSTLCGWWWPFGGAVIITERPQYIKRDNLHRLHCTSGPALSYSDGFSIYALNGVRVPEKYINQDVDPLDILKEENVQIRMAVIRKEGYEKLLKPLGARLIDSKPSTRGSKKPIELYEVGLPEIGLIRLLRVTWFDTNTEQETFLTVPANKEDYAENNNLVPSDINNAELVRIWTMGIDTNKYEIISES